jgi:predicted dehydrogenase
LQETSALAISAYVAGSSLPAQPKPADRINIGIIGTAGQAGFSIASVQQENIVALCDVDENRAAPVRKNFPKAAFYTDYRVMLDKQKDLHAVVVCTPDHHHAFASIPAMRLGKHVYCEKPLAHSVYEVRLMMETAAKHKVKTQMGTQIHAEENYRRCVEIVQAGVLGPIRRVHVWCNKRPDAGTRPAKEMPPPKGMHWDLWVGPAPFRAYPDFDTVGQREPVHFHWRWWWDYGGGMLADMACHYMDLPHWALNLRRPTTISSTGRLLHKGAGVPTLQQVDYEYPARGDAPPVHLTWYHGVAGPDLDGKVTHRTKTAIGPGGKVQPHTFGSGVLFIGKRGSLLADYHYRQLLPEGKLAADKLPKPSIARSLGHHREWLTAIRDGGTTLCNFDYSGALTETVLLGNVAYHVGGKIQYDAKTGRVTNNEKAAQYLRREYRKGWSLT